jgi:hypothetical protein
MEVGTLPYVIYNHKISNETVEYTIGGSISSFFCLIYIDT